MPAIADRLFARCGELVDLAIRSDVVNVGGGITESYTVFATGIMAKIVEVGTLHQGAEQVEEGMTHIVTILDFGGANVDEYVMHGDRRMRVQRVRLIGPPDIRFRQLMCEEIENAV